MIKNKVIISAVVSATVIGSFYTLAGPGSSGSSEHQQIIKDQILTDLDSSRTLGMALEHRQRCKSFRWEDETDQQGRQLVKYTCDMDISESNNLWKGGFEKYIKDVTFFLRGEKAYIEEKQGSCQSEINPSYCMENIAYKKKAIISANKTVELASELNNVSVTQTKQIITWSVLKGAEYPVTLLSSVYKYKLSSGEEYDVNQTKGVMNDVYGNSNTLNPMPVLVRQKLNKLRCDADNKSGYC
ncbi:hypothetical protein P5G64_11390 [Serratia nevei]|uniref:hypothetical protein n=1 Tax=Serratia TaxID=613 RepID=UPI001A308479|nr:hypothetical protein [Serratia marcescens]MDF8318212.1 hypothetical protein [Serratia nevei]MDF8324480.1 hypothetical protein [Serratia nevei]MDF8338061.1 hypothetical protein [Serratia nevei]MDF8344338.1 hypothetical protein [Serratia nevei]MDF8349085.1 hypothetical protein [Serratia nevei]